MDTYDRGDTIDDRKMVRGEKEVGHADTKGLRPLDPVFALRAALFIALRAGRWRAEGARTVCTTPADLAQRT